MYVYAYVAAEVGGGVWEEDAAAAAHAGQVGPAAAAGQGQHARVLELRVVDFVLVLAVAVDVAGAELPLLLLPRLRARMHACVGDIQRSP